MTTIGQVGLGIAVLGVAVQGFGYALAGNILIAVGGGLIVLGALIRA